MSAPVVSVVVPTHDRAELLPRLLRSVLGQREVDLELLVVDDGSGDHTGEVLARCGDPRLRVLRHPTAQGVAAARNTGTTAARGRWVAWCDDDDVWAPAKLRLQLQALDASPGAVWSNGGSVYVDNDLRLSRVRRCPSPQSIARDILRLNAVTGGGSGVLADRELALALGGFDTSMSMYADWDMWARLAHAGPLAVVDLPIVGYVEHAGGMSQRGLHLALEELDALEAALARLASRRGMAPQLDRHALGHWMLRQQVASGRRQDNVVLPFRLLSRGLLSPWKAVAYSLATGLTPEALRRRWAGHWLLDAEYVGYARSWLADWELSDGPAEPELRRPVA